MEERILKIMRGVFENESIDTTCKQANCAEWDSLHHLSLISDLEDEFDVEFEPEEIAQMLSFSFIKEIISMKCMPE